MSKICRKYTVFYFVKVNFCEFLYFQNYKICKICIFKTTNSPKHNTPYHVKDFFPQHKNHLNTIKQPSFTLLLSSLIIKKMRIVAQRVSEASVTIDGNRKSEIGCGMMILLGIEEADNEEDVEWLCNKLSKMRIFSDENDAMNLDICQVGGSFLVVSQFTLHAMTKKGNRPSFIRAARPEHAIPLYELFLKRLHEVSGRDVQSGVFGAMMEVALINDGPVTIIMDSKNKE